MQIICFLSDFRKKKASIKNIFYCLLRFFRLILIACTDKCLYRSIDGTYTSKNTPKMPVQVPLMDLYGHLASQSITGFKSQSSQNSSME